MSRNTLLKTPFSEVCDLGNLLRNIVNLILLFGDQSTLSYAAYNMPPLFTIGGGEGGGGLVNY